MKISDVKQITESPVHVLERSDFSKYVELPCLEACLYLYDMNIHTYSSGCNSVNSSDAHIMLEYKYLDEENRIIVNTLVSKGLARKIEYNNEIYITISIPTKESDDVKVVSDNLLDIVKEFKLQDLLYGYKTKEDFMREYFELTKEFKYVNSELIPISKKMSSEELEERKMHLLYEFNDIYEEMIDEGCVDLENDLVWENSELFKKHIDYLESEKRMGIK